MVNEAGGHVLPGYSRYVAQLQRDEGFNLKHHPLAEAAGKEAVEPPGNADADEVLTAPLTGAAPRPPP